LISHAGLAHTGALAYARAKFGLTAPVLATIPARHLGLLFVYELLASRQSTSEFDLFSLDDIDASFDSITAVRFNQQSSFSPGSAAPGTAHLFYL
jgi:cleavage and polyadenylation specificity factor subunit 2